MPRRRAQGAGQAPAQTQSDPDVRVVASTAAAVAVALSAQALSPAAVASLAATLEEFTKHFVIGGFAAAVGTAAVYPLDVLKTRMQVAPNRWPTSFDCARDALATGGVADLYSGLGAQLLGVAPEKSLKIMAYNACHASLLAYLGLARTADLPFAWEALAGAAAGAAQTVIACPLEAAKIPLQMTDDAGGAATGAKRRQTSLWSVLKDLGLGGLFRGADVCLARDVISGAVFFSCFAAAKHAVVGSGQLSTGEAVQAAFLTKLVAGAIAGVPSALLTTPLDVVKTRLQAQPGDTGAEGDDVDGGSGEPPQGSSARGRRAGEPSEAPQVGYTSAWDCLVRTVATDGWSALACGAGERVARLSPQLGITLALYEVLDPVR